MQVLLNLLLCTSTVVAASGFVAPSIAAPRLRTLSSSRCSQVSALRMAELKEVGDVAELIKPQNGYKFIDVRTEDEFKNGHPVGAVNLPAFEAKKEGGFEPNKKEFTTLMMMVADKEKAKLVIGCGSGKRSAEACKWLDEAGYKNVVDMAGGFKSWVDAGLPVKK